MKIYFIADEFLDNSIGGAQLSLQTHIDACPYPYEKIRSREIVLDNVPKQKSFLVIGNFFEMSEIDMFLIERNYKYVVIECDYKYCRHRSSHVHKFHRGRECDCQNGYGRKVLNFFMGAQHIFFKSERQRDEYYRLFPQLRKKESSIVSGVFSDADLDYILSLRGTPRDEKYFVLKSSSWIKGTEESIKFCKRNRLDYRLVGGLEPREALRVMAQSKGLVYFPRGFDTACRMVTEAKLLGIDIKTNDLVQHMTEAWFNAGLEKMVSFLRSRNQMFWGVVEKCATGMMTSAASLI